MRAVTQAARPLSHTLASFFAHTQDDDDMDLALCLSHTGFAVPNSGFADAYDQDDSAADAGFGGGALDFAARASSASPQV